MFDSRIKDRRFKPKWDPYLKKRQQSSDKNTKNKEPDAKEAEQEIEARTIKALDDVWKDAYK